MHYPQCISSSIDINWHWTSVLHRREVPPPLAATAGEAGPRTWLSRRSLKRPSPASTRVRFSSTHHPHLHPSLPSRALIASNIDGNSSREHVGLNAPRSRSIVAPKAPVTHEARPTSTGGAWGACRRVSEVNRYAYYFSNSEFYLHLTLARLCIVICAYTPLRPMTPGRHDHHSSK